MAAWFELPALWAASIAFLFGLLIGSFLNVLVFRLPKAMHIYWEAQAKRGQEDLSPPPHWLRGLSKPASSCPKCGHLIKWYENIPVLSWIFLRARCSACKTPISLRYPFVEIAAGALVFLSTLRFGPSWTAIAASILLLTLLALALIDADTFELPDVLTLPLMWLGLLVNTTGMFASLHNAVIGAAAGYLSLWLMYWLYLLISGREGMGYGDFKLMAALGAWMGWQMLPAIVLLSSLVGAAIGLFMKLGWKKPLPFGPYLAGAGALALFYGPQINAWYLGKFH
ncbi:MAG: A24 family peptidase [Burkholderiaceae bacterium]|nr:A24 family peptidase [Burkholderiaceae bacterium]